MDTRVQYTIVKAIRSSDSELLSMAGTKEKEVGQRRKLSEDVEDDGRTRDGTFKPDGRQSNAEAVEKEMVSGTANHEEPTSQEQKRRRDEEAENAEGDGGRQAGEGGGGEKEEEPMVGPAPPKPKKKKKKLEFEKVYLEAIPNAEM